MKREFLTQFMERLIVELEREQRDGMLMFIRVL